MDVTTLPQLVRNAGRFNEVITVLAKYGIAPWLKNIRADWIQRPFTTVDGQRVADLDQNVRIRMALTDLGTTFIKLGQILSTRPDLVGPELADELEKLQGDTPPDLQDAVRKTIESELGRSPEELFAEFNWVPCASASIGQVHHAKLKNGAPVVVKVQHAGIVDRVRNDVEIVMELAKLAQEYSTQLKQYRPIDTANEFRRVIESELDFEREQRNLLTFARNFADDETVRFPGVHAEYCSRRVLTMDRLDGTHLSNRVALNAAGYDLSDLARRGANMFLQMLFRDGVYHADPHPGNLMVLPKEVIGVLDCGMVGRIDDDLRERIEDMLMAAVDQDADQLVSAVVRLGQLPADFDRDSLRSDIVDYVDTYTSQSIDDFDLSGSLMEMINIVRRHRIVLPSRVALLIKTLVMLEGTAQKLTPDFNLAELFEPYRGEIIKRRLSPARLWRKLQSAQRDWGRLIEGFPSDMSHLLQQVKRGRFDVHLDHRRLDSIVNRLVMGILSAALFMGSAMLWAQSVPPVLWKTSVPGALGCGWAIFLGYRVIRAIQRSERKQRQ